MKLFVDTGNVKEVETLAALGILDGVTTNPTLLWGECISGALSEDAFLATLERAGFYGVSVLKKAFWREVEGARFYSVTVRGFKFEKKAGCRYIGQWATYLGPMKATIDEEGHFFPRGVPVEVCTDTAAKLRAAP